MISSPDYDGPKKRHRLRSPCVVVLLLLTLTGCYHYKVQVPDPDPATQWESRTTSSFFWGLVQKEPIKADDCRDNVIDQVHITTNFGYVLLTVVTLGIWSPMRVRWRCGTADS